MRVLPRALALLALPFLALTAPAAPVVIENVHVVPMDRERVLDDARVVVDNGVIVAVAPASSTPLPANARVIDGHGGYLIPGLADMHVHLYDTLGFASYLAHGVTTVANLNGEPDTLRWRDAVNAGTLLGPTIYTAGPSLNGNPPGNSTFVALEDPAAARREVARQGAAGYDFIKVYSTLSPEVYQAILDEAKARKLAVLGHAPIDPGADAVLQGYQSNIAHMEELYNVYSQGSPRLLGGDRDEAKNMPVIARAVAASGITVTANLFAYADYLRNIADLNGVLNDPEMRFASPAALSEKLPPNNRSLRDDPEAFAKALRALRTTYQKMTKALADAGAPILLGTDTEIFGFPGDSAQRELAELTAAGLTPFQALAAATRDAGAYVGRSIHPGQRFGTITAGSRADLVLLRANPLADVANARAIDGVMLRGKWLSHDDLTRMREELATRTTPMRAATKELNDAAVAGKTAEVARLFRAMRERWPEERVVAEVVLENNADRAHGNAADELALRRLTAELYPRSFSAHRRLAVALLDNGHQAEASAELAKAAALAQEDALIGDELAKAAARKLAPSFDPAGTYSFLTTVRRDDGLQQRVGTITLRRENGGWAGTLSTNTLPEKPFTHVVIGGNRMWLETENVTLVLTVDGDEIRGRFNAGWMNDRKLRGRKN